MDKSECEKCIWELCVLTHGMAKDNFIYYDQNGELYNPKDALQAEYTRGIVTGLLLAEEKLSKRIKE